MDPEKIKVGDNQSRLSRYQSGCLVTGHEEPGHSQAVNFNPPCYLVLLYLCRPLPHRAKEEGSLSGSLSEVPEGTSQRALKAFPSSVYTGVLWPIDTVLLDCREGYGREILERSMYIKIQCLDFTGIPRNKKTKKQRRRKHKCRAEGKKWDPETGSVPRVLPGAVHTDSVGHTSWCRHLP